MSALSSLETALYEEPSVEVHVETSPPRPQFRLVTGPPQPDQLTLRRAPRQEQDHRRPGQRRPIEREHVPVRLTRRGRLVASILAVGLAAVVLTVISIAAPGGAQAANHGRQGAGYQGMREIVVQPGQTLWSIAAKVEPSADPRLVSRTGTSSRWPRTTWPWSR